MERFAIIGASLFFIINENVYIAEFVSRPSCIKNRQIV